MILSRPIFPLFALLLSACSGGSDEGPVVVSAIGGPAEITDPNRAPPDNGDRILLSAVAQGLVSFDATGQIEPALAQRWIVTDDGLSYIFRLRRSEWPNGKLVTADEVARRLRAAIARNSRNPLKVALEAIDEIVVITPEVLEIRLISPRPPLLELLAQPEMAMLLRDTGTGPFRVVPGKGRAIMLSPAPPADMDEEEKEEQTEVPPERTVVLRGERAAMAVARFAANNADLVVGGRIGTLAIARAAEPRQRELRFDRPMGLFGIVVVENDGLLADPENRRALAMALDRDVLVEQLGVPGWGASIAILPERYRSAADPALPSWSGLDMNARRDAARSIIARWNANRESSEPVAPLRLALPDLPGSRVIFAKVAADWRQIGVQVQRVPPDADADLRMIDEVAPADSAIWYLATLACPIADACDPAVKDALEAARASPTLAERGIHLANADRAVTQTAVYIPIARPIRWSLVSQRLTGFRENPRAFHSLVHLRGVP